MTKEQFENLQIGDKVKHPYGGIGTVTYKDNGTYTVLDTGFDPELKGRNEWSEVSFAWNEGEIM